MFINALAILILSYAEHKRSVRPSSLLNIYLLFSLIFDAAQCRTLYLDGVKSLVSGVFTAGMGVKAVLLFLEAQSKMSYLRYPYRDYSPETISGVFNRSLFLWLNRLFRMGFRSLLAPTDLLTIDNKFKSEPLGTRMRQSWEHRGTHYSLPPAPRHWPFNIYKQNPRAYSHCPGSSFHASSGSYSQSRIIDCFS